tara:strand:- start:59416 stop:60957 length:1542 start_codon:yes stop_codon:yes gene_type:complete
MHWTRKTLILLLIIITGSLLFLQYKFKSEIINTIENKLPPNIQLNYDKIDVNVFSGVVKMDSLTIKLFSTNDTIITTLNANNFKITGFSLWQLLMKNTIYIEDVIFENPDLEYYQYQQAKELNSNKEFDKIININKISFLNGSLKIKNETKDRLLLRMDSIYFTMNDLNTDSDKIKGKIPFDYHGFQLKSQQLFLNLSTYEELKISSLSVKNDKFELKDVHLKTKFTKEKLSAKISLERDHIQLHIPELTLNGLDYGFNNNKFYLTIDRSLMVKPSLKLYRDKTIADDLNIKSMYSKKLRELPFDLSLHHLKITEGYISYAENVDTIDEAGELFFNDVNADLTNLTNRSNKGGNTAISTTSNFMGKAPMDLSIRFDVGNKNDVFLTSGQFKNFNAEIANTFFESNLNAKAEGIIEEVYFTFNGNNLKSKGDLKMKYKEFKFEILDKKNRVNKLLSAIGNLFVNDGSKTDQDGYRYGEIDVERDKTKSFFNYLWINVQDGLVSTLTGKGEKNKK